MSPKDFDWTHDQTVVVSNPTEHDFRFSVHSKEYMIRAGKTAELPGYIAWSYVDGIARHVANEKGQGQDMIDPVKRLEHFDKYIVGINELVREVADEEEPEVTVFGDDRPTAVDAPKTGETYVSKFEKAAKSVRQSSKS